MRGFAILVWCLVTALMFYSAWRYKAPEIETDIMTRVSEVVTEAGGEEVAVEVDGRHVNLRGFVKSEDQKANFLDTADNTYGALGPIDGLMLPSAPARTFLSAARTSDGVVLSGVVGSEAEREALVTQAASAGLGNIQDDLTVADGQIGWSGNAATGFSQLASLDSGHLYVSDDLNTLSGNAPTAEVEMAASALGDGWNSFVAGPVQVDPRIATLEGDVAERDTQITDLTASLTDRDDQIGLLNTQITGLQTDLTNSQNEAATFQTTIGEKDAEIALLSQNLEAKDVMIGDAGVTVETQAGRITELEAELANKATLTGNMEAKMATMTSSLALLRQDGGEQTANLEAALAEKTAEVTTLENEMAALSASSDQTISDLNTTIADLTAQKDEADTTLVTANQARVDEQAAFAEEIASLKTEVETLNGSLVTTNEARVAALDLNNDLQAQLGVKTAEVETLTGQLAEQNTQVATLSSETETLKGQLAEFDATRAQLGELETTVTDRDAKIAALMLDLQNQPTGDQPQTVAQCNDTATGLLASGKINFVTNSADILDESAPLLERITGVVLACSGPETGASVTVAGHTDSRGGDDDNQLLSEARASSVARFMIDRGVDPKALQPVGFGETQPIADNETTEGRAENRRISFEFKAQ